MALRNIRYVGDDILTKTCKPVREVTDKIRTLVEDMLETMYDAQGVGLAAPQVGIRRRIVVVDVTEEQNEPIILINPEIVESNGSQTGGEGCLSVPNKVGQVTRPEYVKVKAYNLDMEEIFLEGEGLLARAFCHEIDHLDGILYMDKMEGELQDVRQD